MTLRCRRLRLRTEERPCSARQQPRDYATFSSDIGVGGLRPTPPSERRPHGEAGTKQGHYRRLGDHREVVCREVRKRSNGSLILSRLILSRDAGRKTIQIRHPGEDGQIAVRHVVTVGEVQIGRIDQSGRMESRVEVDEEARAVLRDMIRDQVGGGAGSGLSVLQHDDVKAIQRIIRRAGDVPVKEAERVIVRVEEHLTEREVVGRGVEGDPRLHIGIDVVVHDLAETVARNG
jgi:hypothetical protein